MEYIKRSNNIVADSLSCSINAVEILPGINIEEEKRNHADIQEAIKVILGLRFKMEHYVTGAGDEYYRLSHVPSKNLYYQWFMTSFFVTWASINASTWSLNHNCVCRSLFQVDRGKICAKSVCGNRCSSLMLISHFKVWSAGSDTEQKTPTTAYHPMRNGLLERYNKKIKKMFRSLIKDDPQTWDDLSPARFFPFDQVKHNNLIHPSRNPLRG
ncbi:hypothetical protein RF11_15919 [Thelohanellus kitauei]|uniref:Integrase catalytic domain-containing protein n=1 Tax=Thelohanellus kitauei TaxID=669202 RepID=A0A0C2IID2_THEKT|nr:hypothetical protein RF11_15919 [Thelohanellus kitauei]